MKKVREIPSFVYDPSCVLYVPLWKRDGSTFISDDGYGHLCTVTGATWGLQGRIHTDDNDTIIIPDADSLDMTTNLSVLLWLKPTATGGTIFIAKRSDTSYSWEMGGDGSGNLLVRINSNTNVATQGTYSANVFTFFGGTYDSAAGQITAYINNSSSQAAYSTAITVNTVNISLGARFYYPGAEAYTNGTYGELIIFNRTLPPTEMERVRQETKWRYA